METKKATTKKLSTVQRNISKIVLDRVTVLQQSGEMRIPKDYSPENALKSAYLVLSEQTTKTGKPVLQACSQESVANSLLKMVVYGLSPMKKQCDFIPYGNKLECQIEYTGNIALAKRYGGLKDIKAQAVFQDDVFEFGVDVETGRKEIKKHEQKLENLTKQVVGAYAVVEMMDGTFNTEIMNIDQIRKSWNQGATKGKSPAHQNFPDQMAIKTVINRACKLIIRGSDDNILFANMSDKDRAVEDVAHEIDENANVEELVMENETETITQTVEAEEVEEITPVVDVEEPKGAPSPEQGSLDLDEPPF